MRWLMLLAAAGCTQILGVKDITLGDAGSGSGSGRMDSAFTACITDPTITLFKPCFATLPASDYTMPPGSYDTGACANGTVQAQGAGKPDVCVVAAMNLSVTAPIRPYGSRPLVLAAVHDVTVSAMIDVSGDESAPAAGAHPSDCTGTTAGGLDATSPGGGGGGAFGGASAGGGAGAGGALGGAGIGGIGKLMSVRGGCDGAAGGEADAGTAGTKGTAGGAVYLVAANSVTINAGATIAAAGGGGGGGKVGSSGTGGGGGGGASGGLIAIEAPTVGLNGVVYANGGGGGGGGGPTGPGGAGGTGTLSSAAGGTGAGNMGGPGGVGGVGTTAPAVGGQANANGAGGGGGGGSIGIIWLNYTFADTSGSSVSPDPVGP